MAHRFKIDNELRDMMNFSFSQRWLDDLFDTKAEDGREAESALKRYVKKRNELKNQKEKELDTTYDFMRNTFDRVLNNITDKTFNDMNQSGVYIKDEDDKMTIELSAPGRGKEDFIIEVQPVFQNSLHKQELLTVKAEKKDKSENGYVSSFAKNSFAFKHLLPMNLVSDEITARYDNGVLLIEIPKKQKETKEPPSKLIAVM